MTGSWGEQRWTPDTGCYNRDMGRTTADVPGIDDLRRRSRVIPALETGDRLARAEFERRYANMPSLKKAELIKGVVYLGSPVRFVQHGRPHALAAAWLAYYAGRTPGVEVADNTTLRLDEQNETQPDLVLRLPESAGGASPVDPDGYLCGPVELVMEVAASSVSIDAHDKRDVYLQSGVGEFVLWRTEDRVLEWFALRGGRYEVIEPDAGGTLRSQQFAGLWLNTAAMLSGDLPAVIAGVDAGTATAEHRDFIRRLSAP